MKQRKNASCVKFLQRFRKRKGLAVRYVGRESFLLSYRGLILLLGCVSTIWFLFGLGAYLLPSTAEESGQFGDMFGGITALFSGLAFAGLIFTLFVQKKELQYQREELSHLVNEQRETKVHLKDQADHLKSQSDFIEKQIFENTFFQMLQTFNSFIQTISKYDGNRGVDKTGPDALEMILHEIQSSVHRDNAREIVSYEMISPAYRNDLGPYFRQVYNILKFLENSKSPDKLFYSGILRAQLSSAELTLIAYTCCSKIGKPKLAPLAKDYALLKHLDEPKILKGTGKMHKFFVDWDFALRERPDQ